RPFAFRSVLLVETHAPNDSLCFSAARRGGADHFRDHCTNCRGVFIPPRPAAPLKNKERGIWGRSGLPTVLTDKTRSPFLSPSCQSQQLALIEAKATKRRRSGVRRLMFLSGSRPQDIETYFRQAPISPEAGFLQCAPVRVLFGTVGRNARTK
ncbi:MAG TPA: hypothetical protein VJA21_24135, partial [Verrucomicrobiae bacterium]